MRVTRWFIDAMAFRERLGFQGGAQSTNSEIIGETFASAGAYVIGRRMMDGGELPWGDTPPFHAPVFVVTHRSEAVAADAVDVKALAVWRKAGAVREVPEHRIQMLRHKLHVLNSPTIATNEVGVRRHIGVESHRAGER
jgi:hypothetical protein